MSRRTSSWPHRPDQICPEGKPHMAPTQPPGSPCRHRRTEVRWSIAADPAAAVERSQGRCPKQGQPPRSPPSTLGQGGRRAAAGRQARRAARPDRPLAEAAAAPPGQIGRATHAAGRRTTPTAQARGRTPATAVSPGPSPAASFGGSEGRGGDPAARDRDPARVARAGATRGSDPFREKIA